MTLRKLQFKLILSSFTAELTLVESGNVKLELHDLTGRFLMTLYAGELEAGSHLLELKPELPAGVYLCHLTADGLTQTHKLFRTE